MVNFYIEKSVNGVSVDLDGTDVRILGSCLNIPLGLYPGGIYGTKELVDLRNRLLSNGFKELVGENTMTFRNEDGISYAIYENWEYPYEPSLATIEEIPSLYDYARQFRHVDNFSRQYLQNN